MLKDVTLGQYYPVDSLLHRLDPRTKLAGTVIYIVALFLCKSFVGYGLAALFLFAVIKLSNVPFSYMVRGLKGILVLLLITYIVVEYVNFGIYLPVSATMAIIALPLTVFLFTRNNK